MDTPYALLNARSRVRKIIRFTAKLLIAVFSVSIVCVAAELALQKIDYHYYPMDIQVLGTYTTDGPVPPNQKKYDWRRFHMFEDGSFEYDPELFWKPNTEYAYTVNGKDSRFFNELGYPGPIFDPINSDGKIRIVTLGDSNTLGIAEYDEETNREISWPAYLENKLGKDYQVINAGVWGYSTFQIYRKFRQITSLKPDIIVLSNSMNDILPVGIQDQDYTPFRIAQTELMLRSRLLQYLQGKIDRIYAALDRHDYPLMPRVSLHDYGLYLRKIIEESRQKNIFLILATRPIFCSDGATDCGVDFRKYNDLTLTIAAETKTGIIDTSDIYASQSALFMDDAHLGKEGLKDMGEHIAVMIEKEYARKHQGSSGQQ